MFPRVTTHKHLIDALETRLNNAAKSWQDASDTISEVLNDIPDEGLLSKTLDVTQEYLGALRGTYAR